MLHHNTMFILSAETVNTDKTIALADVLMNYNIPFKAVSGLFEGRVETSFIVFGETYRTLVLNLADFFNQTHVLEIAQGRLGFLLDVVNGTETFIGNATITTEQPAADYTQLGDTTYLIFNK